MGLLPAYMLSFHRKEGFQLSFKKMAVISDEWKTFLEKMSKEEFLAVVNG